MTTCPTQGQRNIAVLVYEGVRVFELGVAFEVFSSSRPNDLSEWYDVRACSAEGEVVKSDSGFQIVCGYSLASLDWANTIIIPGWRDITETPPNALLDVLKIASNRGCRIVSFCSGAFVLAHAGLLDGRRATTHWRWSSRFRDYFPKVDLRAESLFQQSGNISTSGGSSSALDLCLALVEQDCGLDTAIEVSRRIIMPLRRGGNQAQFFGAANDGGLDEKFGCLERFVLDNLGEQISVNKLATIASMSERTFLRKFSNHYCTTPAKWLRQKRLMEARSLLRRKNKSVAQVGNDVGFQDLPAFVSAFRKEFQMTPALYRKSLLG
ncbi:MAG: helix-turn-helix domain-containing protein [Sedimenticola sp.]